MVQSISGNAFGRKSGSAALQAVTLMLFATGGLFAQPSPATVQIPPAPAPSPVGGQIIPDDSRSSPMPATPQNARAAELWQDKPLGQLQASIARRLPDEEKLSQPEFVRLNQAAPLMTSSGSMFSMMGDSRPWMLTTYEWEAPATRHLPLFFEEPNLERLGYRHAFHTRLCGDHSLHAGDCLQPLISAAKFFGRIPLIPYMCGVNCPFEPVYTLDVDRPGSPVPYRRTYIPVSLKGAIYQAGATVGLIYCIP